MMSDTQLWSINNIEKEGDILLSFLSNLTIEVRDVLLMKEHNMLDQIRVFNQINHMIFPYLKKLFLNVEESYTLDIVMNNLSHMGLNDGIQGRIDRSWAEAKSCDISSSK